MALFQSCVGCQNACCWDISVVKQQFKIQCFIHIWYITVFVFKFTTSNHNKEVCITFLTSVLLLVALMPPQGNWSWKNNDWIILTPSSHTLLKLNCVVNVARIYVCEWQEPKAGPLNFLPMEEPVNKSQTSICDWSVHWFPQLVFVSALVYEWVWGDMMDSLCPLKLKLGVSFELNKDWQWALIITVAEKMECP